MEINIQSVRFKADQKLTEYIETKLLKLKKFNERVVDLVVYLKLENAGQIKDKIVEIKAYIPGNPIFVSDAGKTFESAFDDALDAVKRQFKKQNERMKAYRS